MELDGAVMLITGSGSGIGAATARAAHAAERMSCWQADESNGSKRSPTS